MKMCDNNTKYDDETLHRDAEKVEKYYMEIMGRMLQDEFDTCKDNLMTHGEWERGVVNYCNDRLKYGVSTAECRDFRMRVPFSCLISGKSQCGKTELLVTILSQWRYITTDHSGQYSRRLYWFYGTASIEQTNRVREIFEQWRDEDGVDRKDTELHFIQVTSFKDDKIRLLLDDIRMAIVVFDDLMNEMCSDETITNFFSRECHHRKLCIFHVWQNLFPQKKYAVTLSRNTQYKIIFENPELRIQLNTMLVQMYPNKVHQRVYNKIMDFFQKEPPTEFPFVMFRTSPQEKNRDCTIIGYAVNRNVDDLKNHIFTKPPVVIM